MDRVRIKPNPPSTSVDAVAFDVSGETWVRGRQEGVSCWISPNQEMRPPGKWWELPFGSWYDDTALYLYSPDGDHWYWAPEHDMPLSDFVAALMKMNDSFH